MELEVIEDTIKNGKQLLIGTDPADKQLCSASIYNQTGLIREKHIISNDLHAALMILTVLILGGKHLLSNKKQKNIRTIELFYTWIVKHEVYYHILRDELSFEGVFRTNAHKKTSPEECNHISIKADSIISLMEKTIAIDPMA